ncbi:MAG: hypothetical protein CMA12_08865 [Euryarchaeota archaeon]|nr:hypothetical protein [Euryarchaeota archaeon]
MKLSTFLKKKHNINILNKNLRIYINKISENWIVDRQRNEFISRNKKIVTNFQYNSNLIWIIAPWTWENINKKHLKNKKVICTIHHIDEYKLKDQINSFKKRDNYVDKYHVTNQGTKKQLQKLTDKEIYVEPFWVNSKNWFEIEDKESLRKNYDIDNDAFIIGSFQRDSEGSNLSTPKLSKGPDQFIKILKLYKEEGKNILVILSGKRRNYIINELKNLDIKYLYFEMVDLNKLNELYNLLDLYIVASRFEGGPQSIYECALTKTPIISTNVGIANEILSDESIFNMNEFSKASPNTKVAYNNVQKFIMDVSMPRFIKFMEKI